MTTRSYSPQAGILLPTIIILTATAMTIAVGLLSFTASISAQSSSTVYNQMALSAARSAIEVGRGLGPDAQVPTKATGTGSKIFAYTGNPQSWTVPANVSSIAIEAWGAQGQGSGGYGGHAKGTLNVSPGESLSFYVGGRGANQLGGFNGGGNGLNSYNYGGGGGASDVRQSGTALSDRKIVAGGGGASGTSSSSGGGGLQGQHNSSGTGGATQTAGGTSGGDPATYGGYAGSFGSGGGGTYGGGGGGYYGGGGGYYNGSATYTGGGGGSSYIGGVTDGMTTAGVRSGDGQVSISWTVIDTAKITSETTLLENDAYKVTYQLQQTGTVGTRGQYKGIGRVYVPAGSSTPSYVREVKGVVFGSYPLSAQRVSAGDGFGCGLYDTQPYCWGEDYEGRLGDGGTITDPADIKLPVPVVNSGALSGKTVQGISAGSSHACVIAAWLPYCWGENMYGQLGNNSTAASSSPVAVTTSGALSDKKITAISAGNSHVCAVASGRAYCWGNNNDGKLGNGNTTSSLVPVAVTASGALSGKTVTAISASDTHTCAVASGRAYCWGTNYMGELGNGTTTGSTTPVAVDTAGPLSGKTVTDISTSFGYTCAVADEAPYCWGDNGYGRLGNGTVTSTTTPVAVTTSGVLQGKRITDVATSTQGTTCAIASGQAYCWGYGSLGGLGNGQTTSAQSTPVAVSTSGVLHNKKLGEVTAGYSGAVCAADLSTQQLYCWGINTSGELGVSSAGSSSALPLLVEGP